MTGFHQLSNEELDEKVKEFILNHGCAVDPHNLDLRWGIAISCRKYQVPWPNCLWQLDGHHSLIRLKIVVHGCMDVYSGRIIFLRCSANNLAETALKLFLDAIRMGGNLWPSRIRVDRGVEPMQSHDISLGRRKGKLYCWTFNSQPTHRTIVEGCFQMCMPSLLLYLLCYVVYWHPGHR